MTNKLLDRFKEDARYALENILNDLSNDDTRGYFLSLVTDCDENENTPYTRLYNTIWDDYGWDWQVIEEELPNIIDELVDNFIELYPRSEEDEDLDELDDLEEYYGEYGNSEEELAEHGLEVFTWAESQLLFALPNYRKHCSLINSEEGLDLYGSSAYVVETEWIDSFRDDNLFDY